MNTSNNAQAPRPGFIRRAASLLFKTIFLCIACLLLCVSTLLLMRSLFPLSSEGNLSHGNVRLLSTDGKGPIVGNYVGAPWRRANQWWTWRTPTGGVQSTPALVIFEETPTGPGKP